MAEDVEVADKGTEEGSSPDASANAGGEAETPPEGGDTPPAKAPGAGTEDKGKAKSEPGEEGLSRGEKRLAKLQEDIRAAAAERARLLKENKTLASKRGPAANDPDLGEEFNHLKDPLRKILDPEIKALTEQVQTLNQRLSDAEARPIAEKIKVEGAKIHERFPRLTAKYEKELDAALEEDPNLALKPRAWFYSVVPEDEIEAETLAQAETKRQQKLKEAKNNPKPPVAAAPSAAPKSGQSKREAIGEVIDGLRNA